MKGAAVGVAGVREKNDLKRRGRVGGGKENSLVLFYVVCVQLEQENEEAGGRNGGGARQGLKNELQTAEQSRRDREDAAE